MLSLSGCVPGTNSTMPRLLLIGTTSYVRTCRTTDPTHSEPTIAQILLCNGRVMCSLVPQKGGAKHICW